MQIAETLRCVAWAVRPARAAAPAVCEVYLLTMSYNPAAQEDMRLLDTQLLQARFRYISVDMCTIVTPDLVASLHSISSAIMVI